MGKSPRGSRFRPDGMDHLLTLVIEDGERIPMRVPGMSRREADIVVEALKGNLPQAAGVAPNPVRLTVGEAAPYSEPDSGAFHGGIGDIDACS